MKKCDESHQILLMTGLSEDISQALRSLIKECDTADQIQSFIPPKDDVNDFFLYKEGTQLVGYLGLYHTSNGRARISGVVHPSYRRRGIFTKLFIAARERCVEKGIHILTVMNEQSSKTGKAFVDSIGAVLQYTTYRMTLLKESFECQRTRKDALFIRLATVGDLDDLVTIGMHGFGTTEADEREYNEYNLNDPGRNLYIGLSNGIVVGMISTIKAEQMARIADLAVHKDHRRKGVGRTLLLHAIDQLKSQGMTEISLMVQTENKKALALYEDCGFQVAGALEFYELRLSMNYV